MKILSLDTSTQNLSIAISKDTKVLAYKNRKLHKMLSDDILPTIKALLDKAGVSLKEIDGFAVGLGPGSFTSLRVGLSTVKGLSFVLKKPVVGISSLDVLAMNVGEDASICTVCDAKRNLVYGGQFIKEKGKFRRVGKYVLTDIKSFLKGVKKKSVFIGDGIELYEKEIRGSSKAARCVDNAKLWFPQAKHLAFLAYEQFASKKTDDVRGLVPIYMYPEDCQVTRKRK